MSDEQLRRLERRFRETGSLADRTAWLRARMREGHAELVPLGGEYAMDLAQTRILHQGEPVRHAHLDTFEVLHADAGWARDRRKVYRFGIHCRGLKPETLCVLSHLFVTDGAKVSTLSGFSIAGADPVSFEVLAGDTRMSYARDAHRIYFFEVGFKPRVLDTPRDGFRALEGPFATDGEAIYYEGYRTKGKLDGFERLGERRWRDAQHTYLGRLRDRR